jgi:hypothetical protein
MATAEDKADRIGLILLARIMRGASSRLSAIVDESFARSTLNENTWATRVSQVETVYAFIRKTWADYANKQFPKQYKRYAEDYLRRATKETMSVLPQMNAVEQIVRDSISRMNLATMNGEENVKTLFKRTQQAILDDKRINELLGQGITSEATVDNMQKLLQDEFTKKLRGGQFLEINGRKYDVEKYSRLVARTRSREAQSKAVIDSAKRIGNDLVRVSKHNTPTEICIPYEEDPIRSISGTDPKYKALDKMPPFHPNSYSADTEVLMHGGWEKIADVVNKKSVCQIAVCPYSEDRTQHPNYVQIAAYYKHVEDIWYEFKGDGVDLMVTWNHSCPIWQIDNQGIFGFSRFVTPDDMYDKETMAIKEKAHNYFFSNGEGSFIQLKYIKIKRIEKRQEAYCLDVGHPHLLHVRRNGQAQVSGNCRHVITPYFGD